MLWLANHVSSGSTATRRYECPTGGLFPGSLCRWSVGPVLLIAKVCVGQSEDRLSAMSRGQLHQQIRVCFLTCEIGVRSWFLFFCGFLECRVYVLDVRLDH
jgi:hypothetical protein